MANLHIKDVSQDAPTVLELSGELTEATGQTLQSFVRGLKPGPLVLDLGLLSNQPSLPEQHIFVDDFVPSLMSLAKSQRDAGQALAVVTDNDAIHKIGAVTGLALMFKLSKTRAEAKSKLGA